MALADYYNKVQAYFVASLGRPASSAELAQYAGALEANNGNVWKAGLVTYIQAQPDFSSDVATVYKNLTGAEPTMAIYNYYTGKMLAGEIKAKGLANAMINDLGFMPKADGTYGAPANWAVNLAADAGATDLTGVQNKITVANTFTSSLDSVAEATSYATAAGKESAKALLAGVTADADTVTTATANVDTTVANIVTEATTTSAVGQTFTLTASADTGTATAGTSGNDIFVGLVHNTAASTTLAAGDVLTGGAGNDTLSVSISGTGVTTSAVIMSGIENVNISNFTTATASTLDLTQATGVSAVKVNASAATGDTEITGLGNLVTAEMASGTGDLTITYTDAAVVGTADAQTLTLSGQTAGSFTVAGATAGGVETLNIVSQTAANTIAINDAVAATIKTMNVSGDKKLTLTEGATNPNDAVTTINAATMTGQLLVTTGSAAGDMSITGGTGNDTITFSGTTFAAADTVNGGDGTDTLSIANTAAMTEATLAKVSNVEVVKLVGAAAALTLNSNVAGVTTIDTTDAGDQVVTLATGYTAATIVSIDTDDTVVNSGANAALTVNMTAAAVVTTTTITGGTGTDTLNITADTNTGGGTDFANITVVDAITVVDGGDDAAGGTNPAGKDIELNVGNYGTSLTVNASALDAGTVTSGTMGADDETMTFTGSSVATATVVLNVTGGAGADTISGGAGNDIINGGAGNDSIDGGTAAGNDSILGGDGDDTINMAAALTSADTIDGGAGNDTLIVTNLSNAALTNVTNVETLSFTGTATLTSNLSFTAIDMSNGAAALTLGTGYTNATTLAMGADDSVTNTANAALTVSASSDNLVVAGMATITGGTGTDTLNVTASTSTVDMSATTAKITKVDVVTVVDNGDAASGTTIKGEDITLNLASYATALTIDASALDAGTVTSGTMGADDETLTISGTSAAKLIVTGGAGADTIVGSSASAGDSLNGGAGNDTITMATNLTYADTIDGGSGTDTMTVAGAATVDVNLMNVRNVETLTLGTTATLSSYFDATGIATVNVGSGALDASGTANAHTFVATAGADTITGGMGNDTYKFTDTKTLTTADIINGTAGTDTILLNNAAASVTAGVDFDNVTNVTNMTVGTASGLAATSAETIALTIAAISATTAQTINVDGSVITDSNDTISITNSAASSTTKFNITGGAGADTLAGSNGADTISAGAGNDSITGGSGADNLTGGTGSDTFAYANLTSSTNAAADTITDFVSGTDVIQITYDVAAGSTFDGTNKGTAASNADALALLSSKIGQYYFNTTTGQMVMDTDANGLIQSTDMVVNITGATSIAAGDVNFVITASANGTNTITTGGGADSITGGTAADTIDGGAGNDTITGGAAADSITGGTGADTIVWTATDASEMATESGAATGDTDFVAGTAGDKVVGFTSQSDKLKFAAAMVTSVAGTETDTLLTIAAAGTVTNTARFVEITTAQADGTTGTAITLLNGLTTTAVAIGDSFIAFINDGTNGYLYLVEQVSAANTIAAQDVTLIGQLTGVTDVANGDFVSF